MPLSSNLSLSGERVVVEGKLSLLSRRDARALVERLGGEMLETPERATIVLIPGGHTTQISNADGIRLMSEAELCETAGLPASDALRAQFKTSRDIRAMYPNIRDEHLRFFEKWGPGRFWQFVPNVELWAPWPQHVRAGRSPKRATDYILSGGAPRPT